MKKYGWLWLLLAIGVVYQFATAKEEWSGFLYPDRNDLSKSIRTGKSETLEECVSGIRRHPNYYGSESDYECGLNCKYDSAMSINVCKETKR